MRALTAALVGLGVVVTTLFANPVIVLNRRHGAIVSLTPPLNAATVVTIEAVQQVDNITYYQITCNNLPGWVSEQVLSGGK